MIKMNVRVIMTPAGYMAKRIHSRPEWLDADSVVDVYSVSNCVSKSFADYINYWKHNGFWLFDSPAIIRQVAQEHSIDLTGTKLFYYEVYEAEFHEDKGCWETFAPEVSFTTNVVEPNSKHLEGYDVVTFYAGTSPECSPLSCNSVAKEIKTNQHCLLSSLAKARQLVEQGKFRNTEPGPYRVFAVYSL